MQKVILNEFQYKMISNLANEVLSTGSEIEEQIIQLKITQEDLREINAPEEEVKELETAINEETKGFSGKVLQKIERLNDKKYAKQINDALKKMF